MVFNALRVAVFVGFLSVNAFASGVNCQSTLTSYLRESEHASWFKNNYSATDKWAKPLLSAEEQKKRWEDHQAEASKLEQVLKDNCFGAQYSLWTSDCSGLWASIRDISSMVGASMSRIDVLNRNPIPHDPELRQSEMDRLLGIAKFNIGEFRKRRNQDLREFGARCLRTSNLWLEVSENYFLKEPQNPSLELIREQFAAAESPTTLEFASKSLKCRMIDPRGDHFGMIVGSESDPELEYVSYDVFFQVPAWRWVSPASFSRFDFYWERDRWVDRQELRSGINRTVTLRVAQNGDLLLEASMKDIEPFVQPIVAYGLGDSVTEYWSCRP